MLKRKNWYLLHRWLGLIIGLQLLMWSVSGLVFTLLDIDNVHGDFEASQKPPPVVQVDRIQITPKQAIDAVQNQIRGDITRVQLRERLGRTVYEMYTEGKLPQLAVDASTGEILTRVTEEEVRQAAMDDFKPDAEITSFKLLQGEPPLEFRGGPMPVYQVMFDHPQNTHLYISPVTGDVLTRRNKPWRLFDFLWMLHIMDYSERDDINHPLLTAASVLAVLTSLSGLTLWIYRIPKRKRRVYEKA